MAELKVISLEEIKKKAEGVVIEIPDWTPGAQIAVRVKAIDMTPHIMKLEKMPNVLKVAATEVFNGSGKKTGKSDKALEDIGFENMDAMLPIIDGVVADVLIEPTFEEVQKVYPLTMEQKMVLFKFAMGGLEKLDSFR